MKHTYQGAMGTEFSLLLNRLLSVISGKAQVCKRQNSVHHNKASLGEKIPKRENMLPTTKHRW